MSRSEELVNTNPELTHFVCKPNKKFPNSRLEVILYREAFILGKQKKKAAQAVQKVFHKNNWKNAWSDGIYSFHHYHSNTHEAIAVVSGHAWIIFGGPSGRRLRIEKGDVVIIPAGVGHKCTKSSLDFLCVGAYPGGAQYDTNLGTLEDFKKTETRIKKLSKPSLDPIFGKEGFLNAI